MSLPLYVLRHSVSSVSPALYASENRDLSVHIIESRLDDHVSSETAAFLHLGKEHGEPGTYRQLLELILTAKKVVTL
jgi:hypothetical protein